MTESYRAWQIAQMTEEDIAKDLAKKQPENIQRRKELEEEIKKLQQKLWEESYTCPTGWTDYLPEAKIIKAQAKNYGIALMDW